LQVGEDTGEIKQCLSGRYISLHEVCCRNSDFETNAIRHNIDRLPVHFPNLKAVIFHYDRYIETALQNDERAILTEFFKGNVEMRLSIQNGVKPKHLLTYITFPEHYAWKK